MIVFNLYCIPVAVLVGLALWGLNSLVQFQDPHLELFAVGVVTTVVAGICEAAGLAARLFFLPVWLIGLGLAGWQTWQLWGWFAVVPVGLGIAALVVWGQVLARREEERWAAAPAHLKDARRFLEAGEESSTWEALENAFFVPEIIDLDAEMLAHDRAIVELLPRLIGTDRPFAREIANRLDTVKADIDRTDDPAQPPEHLFESLRFVEQLIAGRGHVDDEELEV